MTATTLDISTGNIPMDEAPETEITTGLPFNPEYPDSTPDAPYGFFPDGRPRKRRPRGTGTTATSSGPRKTAASDSQARMAAAMLAQVNNLVGMSLALFRLPVTGAQITEANAGFEQMAYEALLTDPALCRKILSAGANSGKAGLVMAYAMLGAAVVPVAMQEMKESRRVALAEGAEDEG